MKYPLKILRDSFFNSFLPSEEVLRPTTWVWRSRLQPITLQHQVSVDVGAHPCGGRMKTAVRKSSPT